MKTKRIPRHHSGATVEMPPDDDLVVRGNGFEIYCEQMSPRFVAEHSHQELQIFVPFKHSSFVVNCHSATGQQQNASFREGDISLLGCGQAHSVEWGKSSLVASFYLTPEFIERAAADSTHGKIEIVPQYGVRDSFIQHLGLALLQGRQAGEISPQIYAESLAHVLGVHLLRNYSTAKIAAQQTTSGLPPQKLRRAAEFINAHLSQDIRLSEIAAELELSPFHFGRMFKRTTGQTPYQYLLEQRIERGKRLLTDAQLPLVEIALQLGFSSQSHFTQVFHRFTGSTPNQYRKKL